MEFKDRIRQLRIEKDMSPAQLAAIFDNKKSEAAIRAWELGRSKPDADTLLILAQHFDCSTDYLLGISNLKNEKEERVFDISSKRLLNQLLSMPEGKELLEGYTSIIDAIFYIDDERLLSAYAKAEDALSMGLMQSLLFVEGRTGEVGTFITLMLLLNNCEKAHELASKILYMRLRELVAAQAKIAYPANSKWIDEALAMVNTANMDYLDDELLAQWKIIDGHLDTGGKSNAKT